MDKLINRKAEGHTDGSILIDMMVVDKKYVNCHLDGRPIEAYRYMDI